MYSKDEKIKNHIGQVYRTFLAQILCSDIVDLIGKRKRLLDIGGGKGEYCKILQEQCQLDCVNLDVTNWNPIFFPTIVAAGQYLPFKNDAFDIILCRSLLEHVPQRIREQILKEMYRVLKKEGVGQIAIPPWLNPHAGHALRPFHLLPFKLAVFLTRHLFGMKIQRVKAKSYADLSLYPITFRGMSKLLKTHNFEIIDCKDVLLRNHILTKIPLIREFLVPNVAFNFKKNS